MLSRLFYRDYRWVTAWKHHLDRGFTQRGLLFLGAILVTAMLGLDTNSSFTYQLFTLLAALTALGWLSARFTRNRFEISRDLPRVVGVGQPFEYSLLVRHAGKRSWHEVEAGEVLADSRPTLEEFRWISDHRPVRRFLKWFWPLSQFENARATVRKQSLSRLDPGASARLTMRATPLRRGYLRFDACTISQPDVFGISRSVMRIPQPQSVLVLPKRYRIPHLSLTQGQTYQRGGVALASKIGESEEFVSLRDYRPGDPLRAIHWKSWCKIGKPVVKEFADEFFVRHALVLDTFAPSLSDNALFEEAVSIAASLACVIDTQESLLDLMFVGTEAYRFTAGRSVAPVERMLEILACAEPCRTSPFSKLPQLVLSHSAEMTHCICVLMGWDAERKQLIERLRELDLPVLTLVITPDEAPDLQSTFPQTEKLAFRQIRLGKAAETLATL